MEIARRIVALVAVFNFGGWIADAAVPFTAKQHIRNPHWPPHAKFHHGQTILLGMGLGLYSLFLLFCTGPFTPLHFGLAAVAAALHLITVLLAPLFQVRHGATRSLPRPTARCWDCIRSCSSNCWYT